MTFGCRASIPQAIAVAALLRGLMAYAGEPAAPPLTPQQIAARAMPSVVRIEVPGGLGSGFVVRSDGRIVTNLHVVAGAREATVVLSDGRRLGGVEILAVSDAFDLALLKVPADKLPALSLGDSSRVQVGQRVVAIGNPLGLSNTVSDGLVSALRQIDAQVSLLQLSAPISPGSSGGPIIDERGQVVGVSTLIITQGQNLNFGVAINAVKPMLDAKVATPLGAYKWKTTGKVKRSVPRHELSLLAGCPDASLHIIAERIQVAISVGAPAYNEGNHEGCYRAYASAAVAIDHEVKACAGPREALLAGVRKADKLASFDDKAWAMRDAFDGVLEVIERHDAPAPTLALPAAPARHVPSHPLRLLDDCSPADARQIARAIDSAIGVGAPLYNQGNFEACFRVYEGAALAAQRQVNGCTGAKEALMAGVNEASRRPEFVDKAWAMRDAFDGLIELVRRKWGFGP
jgi:serine protease Do